MCRALLVIDMQKGSFTPTTPRYDSDGDVERTNMLARLFGQTKDPVFFSQHEGSKENQFMPGTTDWELLPALKALSHDTVIRKTANDPSYKSNLIEKLVELGVAQLCITGCATDLCVESTIQSPLAKDFDAMVMENGRTTADRPHLKAEQVITHYNWVWKNMVPTKGKVKVIDMKHFFSKAIALENSHIQHFFRRLDALSPLDGPKFGQMNVNQMVRHCTDFYSMADGSKNAKEYGKPNIEELAVQAHTGKTVPTPKGLGQVEGEGTIPTNLKNDVKMHILAFLYHGNGPEFAEHPYSGKIDQKKWTELAEDHLNQHLNQFGA